VSGSSPLVIGLDCSTTACKAIAWDLTGAAVAQARRSLALLTPRPGWHEQRADDWWTAAAEALREVAGQVGASRLAALSIAHQRETFVPVDAGGRPVRNAIVWMDARAAGLLPQLAAAIGAERFHQITGKPLSGNLSVAKIAWLREHEAETFGHTHSFLDAHAFLIQRLTGRRCTGWGSADPMGLFDMAQRGWADEILAAVGVRPAQMPELRPPAAIIGGVTREASAACGLPSGLPVVCGLGDGQAAGLGANITGRGRAYLNLGTAVVAGTHAESYRVDRAFRATCSGIPGAFLLETVLLGGTYTTNWFCERFGGTAEELDAAVAGLPAGSEGLLLVPYWNSAMNPYWDAAASGIVVGWRGAHDRRHLYRAILEGIAFEQRLHTEGVEAATGEQIAGFTAMGGGSRSALWCQLIADVTGKVVQRCATPDASALGAGILAAAGSGLYPNVAAAAAAMTRLEPSVFTPHAERHAAYSLLYEDVYRRLFPELQPALQRLADLRTNLPPTVSNQSGELDTNP